MTDQATPDDLQRLADLTARAIETLTDTDAEQAELSAAIAGQIEKLTGGLVALVRAVVASDVLDAEAKQTLALELKWLSGETP